MKSVMNHKEFSKRCVLLLLSLFFMGLGVAMTKHGELGVSPISSVANVVSLKFTALSFGTWLTISNCVLLLGQILILRRKFRPVQLLQIPLSFLFGYFTDLGVWLTTPIPNDNYAIRLLLVAAGVAVLGFGISLGITADLILNSGEAFVKAIADTVGRNFGTVKIIFDCSWVALSVVLSLLFFDGTLQGTREGTILSAVLAGTMVRLIRPRLQPPLERFLHR